MHHLQTTIIEQYQIHFPNETLKNISHKTGIQLTRVFRLFNGSEMKISEYETFKSILTSRANQDEFQDLANECLASLSKTKLELLATQMKHQLKNASFSLSSKMSSTSTNHLELA